MFSVNFPPTDDHEASSLTACRGTVNVGAVAHQRRDRVHATHNGRQMQDGNAAVLSRTVSGVADRADSLNVFLKSAHNEIDHFRIKNFFFVLLAMPRSMMRVINMLIYACIHVCRQPNTFSVMTTYHFIIRVLGRYTRHHPGTRLIYAPSSGYSADIRAIIPVQGRYTRHRPGTRPIYAPSSGY